MGMPLEIHLAKSGRWMRECASLVDGIAFETTDRLRVAVSLLHLSIEHQTGIHVLVEHGVIGSAFALMRPQFEAYLRGVWFHRCATDTQVSGFLSGKEPPKVGNLIAAVHELEGYEEGYLGKARAEIWSNLNDFTHGGAIQVKARITRDGIVSNYLHEHIAGLLQSAATLSLLSGVAIAKAVGDSALANNLLLLYQRLYGAEA
jgi:hypothetical protein